MWEQRDVGGALFRELVSAIVKNSTGVVGKQGGAGREAGEQSLGESGICLSAPRTAE